MASRVVSPSREVASASISSRKMIVGPISAHASKHAASFCSASPYHLDTTLSSGRLTNGRPSCFARMRAADVLPQPGGPSKRTAFACGWTAASRRVPCITSR